MSRLRFSTADKEEISEYIAKKGGLSEPSQEDLDEIQERLDYFNGLDDFVFEAEL